MDKVRDYSAIFKASEFTSYVDKLIADGKPVGYDIESGYKGPNSPLKLAVLVEHPNWTKVGFSFTNEESWARYVPLNHDDEHLNVDDPVQVARDLWRLLTNCKIVAHNSIFELHGSSKWLMQMLSEDPELGDEIKAKEGFFPIYEDTMLYAFNLDSWHGQLLWEVDPDTGKWTGRKTNIMTGKDLKSLTLLLFKHKMIEFKELFADLNLPNQNAYRFNILQPIGQPMIYACEDAVWCLKLLDKCYEEAKDPSGAFDPLSYQIDKNIVPISVNMNKLGIPLDWDLLRSKLTEAQQLKLEMNDEIMETLSERLGEVVSINLGSAKQVAHVLYDRLNIPLPIVQRKESRSTAEKALASIAKSEPLIRDILTYRTVVKLIGSYLNKYITTLDYKGDEKAYPTHNPAGAISGRFSVDGMSYQQLPKPYHYKLENGREFFFSFRDTIKAPEGFRIVGFDYSQIQLRMIAGMAQETAMLKAFATGIDIHTATASAMLKIPADQITGKQRSDGKFLNFSNLFGQGPAQLAAELSTPDNPVSVAEATIMLSDYFAGFPKLRAWMDGVQSQASSGDFVRSIFNRRFKIWEFESPLSGVRNKGNRMAVNEPVQGAEAYYVKMAMIRATKAIESAGLKDKIKLAMMIHDALEFFVHDSVSDQEVIDLLQDQVRFSSDKYLPDYPVIDTDWHVGDTLGSVIEIKLDVENKVQGYYIELEYKGLDKVTLTGDTFEEVRDKLKEWNQTKHPEILAKQNFSEIEVEEKPKEEPKEIEVKHITIQVNESTTRERFLKFLSILKDKPGNNKVTISLPTGEKELPGSYDITEKDQPLVNLNLGSVLIFETKKD